MQNKVFLKQNFGVFSNMLSIIFGGGGHLEAQAGTSVGWVLSQIRIVIVICRKKRISTNTENINCPLCALFVHILLSI